MDIKKAISIWAKKQLAAGNLVLDTETTGLRGDAEIVSIAIINTFGQPLYHAAIQPTIAIPAAATAIHGIRREYLTGALSFAGHWEAIKTIVTGRTVLIYNAGYDTRIIKQSYSAIFDSGYVEPFTSVDVMQAYANFSAGRADASWLKLTVAAHQCGVSSHGAHGALDDCRMTLGVLRYMAGYDEN